MKERGKPSQKKSFLTFGKHIKEGSTLVHGKEKAHSALITKLSLKSISYDSKELKGLPDSENPLDLVNRIHCLLKMFLNAHSSFNHDDLQNYLNVYTFAINPPSDPLEKVEKTQLIWLLKTLKCLDIELNLPDSLVFYTPCAKRDFNDKATGLRLPLTFPPSPSIFFSVPMVMPHNDTGRESRENVVHRAVCSCNRQFVYRRRPLRASLSKR